MKFSNELTPDMAQSMKHLTQGYQSFFNQPDSFSKLMEFWSDILNTEGNQQEEKPDRRFKHNAWSENPIFKTLKDNYLGFCQNTMKAADLIEFDNDLASLQFKYFLEQFLNTLSPSNNPYLNPAVIEKTVATGGQNFVQGYMNFMNDMQRFEGLPSISMVEEDAFEVGKDIAVTEGKVVFENELMQLIAYLPENKVFETPLLIIPPWINKFYILDLTQKNSFVKWLAERGQQVYLISWKNPTVEHSEKGFEHYMHLGPNAAYEFITKTAKSKKVNALGFCIGGTLLSITQSWRLAKKQPGFNTLTYLTSLMDFSEPGDIKVYIDEDWINMISQKMDKSGVLDGRILALTFTLLRSNDLYWSFFINNYLLGEKPADFDLLYWNSDSTNLPKKMHDFYLREMYLENKLIDGKLEIDGVKIDLKKNTADCFFLSTEQDHIAPWKTTYTGALSQGGNVEFVLGGSGHIAGVINPPTRQKYGFRTGAKLHSDAEKWYESSSANEGSWWPHYQSWLASHSGKLVNNIYKKLPDIEPAPGRYVKEKISLQEHVASEEKVAAS